MERIMGLIKKEFIHFYRDPVAMALILYHFTACIVLCGYCFTFDAKHLSTVVYDSNRSAASRELIQKFLSTEYFTLDSFATTMEDVQNKMESGKARVALVIPPEFTRNLAESRPAPIQFISDGSNSNQAGQGAGFAKRIIATYNQEILLEKFKDNGLMVSQLPTIENQARALYNQEMKSVYFVVLYHVVIAGLIGGLVLSSTALVREKERGTIDQLLVTPIRSWELLLAKSVAPLIIGLIATVFSFLIIFWFDVPCKGSVLTFFVYMGLFLVGITGIGILIGSLCKNMLQAILLSFVAWFPGAAMTGTMTPVENMLPFMQKIAQIWPTTHFLIAANGIFQKANGFGVHWPQALTLILIGTGLMFIGWIITRRQWKQ